MYFKCIFFLGQFFKVYSNMSTRMYKEISSLFYIRIVAEDSNKFEPIILSILTVFFLGATSFIYKISSIYLTKNIDFIDLQLMVGEPWAISQSTSYSSWFPSCLAWHYLAIKSDIWSCDTISPCGITCHYTACPPWYAHHLCVTHALPQCEP